MNKYTLALTSILLLSACQQSTECPVAVVYRDTCIYTDTAKYIDTVVYIDTIHHVQNIGTVNGDVNIGGY